MPARPRVAIYVRTSTKNQETQQQEDFCREYYQRNLSSTHDLLGVFVDWGVSAWTKPWLERDAGAQMYRSLQFGDAVIIQRLDRAVRSVSDGANTWEILGLKNIDLHCVDGGRQQQNHGGKFLYSILAAVNQLQSDVTSARVREKMLSSRLRGECISKSPPPGYTKVLSGEFRKGGSPIYLCAPCEDERTLLTAAVKEAYRGCGIRMICNRIFKAGLRRGNGKLMDRRWMAWALHCCVLDWPLTFTEPLYVKYRMEQRQNMPPNASLNKQYLQSLTLCKRLIADGVDLGDYRPGLPYIPSLPKNVNAS